MFRDLNFALDVRAASAIVAVNLPLSLVPYDAAREVELTAHDLDRLAAAGGALSWLAERARGWLGYWQHDIGRAGFYPFDLLAAAYLIEPQRFGCAPVTLWVGKDPTLFIPLWQPTALLVGQGKTQAVARPETVGSAMYCAQTASDIERVLIERLTALR